MKIKTSEATPLQLNWLVAQIEDFDNGDWLPDYSTDWNHGGPIIEREGIATDCLRTCGQIDGWIAATEQLKEDTEDEYSVPVEFHGPTPLIAAMRCFVALKLGDEVDVPEELV